MHPKLPPSPNVVAHLRRLLLLRCVLIAGLSAAIAFAWVVLHMALPLMPLALVLCGLFLLTVVAAWRLRMARAVSEPELFAHLVLDVAALTIVLYYTGGSTNPFAPLYLVPLTLTAAVLPGRYAWAMTAIAVACYSLLLMFYVPLPVSHVGHDDAFHMHVLGMWLGFLLGAVLIAHFAVRMRSRDQLLARLREQALRHERVLALGTLATGAAHELATPLATMAVTVGEMAREAAAPHARLETLRAQIARCKKILELMSANAGQARAGGGQLAPLDAYLEQVLARFKSTHARVTVRTRFSGAQPAPAIVTEETLTQALLNIVGNAADVSADDVEVNAHWTMRDVTLEVLDRGPGLAPTVLEHVAEPFFTTKAPGEGMGLGLFLARSTLERLGGGVELTNRTGGGAVCTVRLPLRDLLIEAR